MKLLNYNELKTLLLEERDKIPLTVPGARYEMNIPQPNKHGESVRCGIRIAMRCMERCQPLTLYDLRPKGRWERTASEHYVECSQCKKGMYIHSIAYSFRNFCPNCGADMRGGGE